MWKIIFPILPLGMRLRTQITKAVIVMTADCNKQFKRDEDFFNENQVELHLAPHQMENAAQ